jgi:MFS family permease
LSCANNFARPCSALLAMPSLTSSSNGPGRASERTHLLPPTSSTPSSGSSTPTASSKSRHHNLAGLPAWRFRVICAALWACTFFCALDGTVVATLLTPIGSAFHASNQASWLGTSYLLALCCFTPIYGRLSDLLGRREAQLIALSFFTVGTFLCAIAPSMYFLIAARCVAGMGGGGVASMGVIIFTDLVDLRRRGLWQGISNIFFGLGGALGGPLGGFISDRWGWRIVFFLQTPLLVAAGIGVFFFVRIPPSAVPKDAEEPWRVKIKRIDYLGSMTLVVAVASLLLSVSLKTSARTPSGVEYAWSDPLIWGLLIVSAVFTFLFLLVEARFALQPILPLSLMSRRTPLAVGLGLFCVVTNQFSIMYNIPLFFSAVRLESASVAGAHLLPYSLALGTGSVTIGYLMRRTGKYWSACVGSAGLMVVTSIMLLFWRTDVPRWLTWVGPIPAGFGYAGVLTSTLVALMTNVTRAGKGEQ